MLLINVFIIIYPPIILAFILNIVEILYMHNPTILFAIVYGIEKTKLTSKSGY